MEDGVYGVADEGIGSSKNCWGESEVWFVGMFVVG